MAFGFPAEYSVEVATSGSRQMVHEAVVGTFESLGWAYVEDEFGEYTVQMPMNPSSFGETLTVTLADRSVAVKSICRWPQMFDWGQNRRNVEQFTKIFSIRQIREAKLGLRVPAYLDAKGKTPVDRMIDDSESWIEETDDDGKG